MITEVVEETVETIGSAIEKYNAGMISVEDLQAIVQKYGTILEFYDLKNNRHPEYPVGDNRSREGFTYNPYFHVRGKLFQHVIKKAILAAIGFAHHALWKQYDKDIFVCDDDRLNFIRDFGEAYITENFKESYPYKHDFMTQILEIVLALAKEDVYYRARLFDAINKFYAFCPHSIPLTAGEKYNLKLH